MRPIHYVLTGFLLAAELVVLIRAILRPHREPASRLAWVLLIVAVPILGVIAYLLLGETRVSLRRKRIGQEIEWRVPAGTRRIRVVDVTYQPEAAGHHAL